LQVEANSVKITHNSHFGDEVIIFFGGTKLYQDNELIITSRKASTIELITIYRVESIG